MTKVKVTGVRTLETGKFDANKAEYTNPPKATIKWSETTPLTEAAIFNNTEAWLLTDAEKVALTEGKDYLMPEHVMQGLKTIATTILDLLSDSESEEVKP